MHAVVCSLILATISAAGLVQQDGRSLPAFLDLPAERVFVGQGVEGRVVVEAGTQRPTLSIGRADGVEVIQLGGVEVETRSSSEIGAVRNVVNIYRFPVRVVARKAGRVTIPAIRADVPGRTGIAPSRTMTALAPPDVGRSATFLGGVGNVVATAEARPAALRLGESFEYRITLVGPGSIGSSEPASIPAIRRVGPGWRVDRLPPEGVVDPPSRTFRVRVRPDRSGTFILGPYLVATFDPPTRTYQTTNTNSVSIRVVDVPVFDVATVDIPRTSGRSLLWPGLALASGMAAGGALVLIAKIRAARSRRVDPRRIASRLIAALPRSTDPNVVMKAATVALAEFYERVGGRPRGALTPEEARRWAGKLSSRAELAEVAADLVASCDRTLYASGATKSLVEDPRERAEFVLRGLGESPGVKIPREAPGTA